MKPTTTYQLWIKQQISLGSIVVVDKDYRRRTTMKTITGCPLARHAVYGEDIDRRMLGVVKWYNITKEI